jgi:periplasmic protein TonB
MSGTLRTGLPISLAVHGLIIAGFVFLFPVSPQESMDEEAVAVEVLDEIVMEKQEAVLEDNITDPVVTSVEVESTAPEVKTSAQAEADIAMDMSSKVEIAVNQPETQAISTEAALTLDMTPDIKVDAKAVETDDAPVAEADVMLDMTPKIEIEADAPQPTVKPVEALLALDMTPNIAIETQDPATKTASVESAVTLDMKPNIAMEQVQSDAAPSPLAEASVMMTIESEVEIAAIDQSAQASPAAEASVGLAVSPPPAAKQSPPPKKTAEKKKAKKSAPKKVAEENFATKTGKTQRSKTKEKAAKIAAQTKKSNTKKSAGLRVSSALQKQKRTGLGGTGEAVTKNNKASNSQYGRMVRARLAASFSGGGKKGRVMVTFTVHPDGRMSGGRIASSSGVGEVDSRALSALRRTRFPPFLPGMPRRPKAFLIPMASN